MNIRSHAAGQDAVPCSAIIPTPHPPHPPFPRHLRANSPIHETLKHDVILSGNPPSGGTISDGVVLKVMGWFPVVEPKWVSSKTFWGNLHVHGHLEWSPAAHLPGCVLFFNGTLAGWLKREAKVQINHFGIPYEDNAT